MIKLLGFRRTLLLGILLGVNAILLMVFALWASPQALELNSRLQSLRSEISTLQTGIQNTKSDLKMLRENLPTYDSLVSSGFMQDQDRFGMSRALEDIKTKARIQGFSFAVGDIQEIANGDAQLAGKRLLHSRIEVSRIASVLDINVFDMLTLIETEYPPHARIHAFTIRRSAEVKPETLKRVREEPVSMLTADVVFDWFSLADVPVPSPPPGAPGRP